MVNVHLVRHGDYDYRDRALETQGQGLTERGRLQAAATGTWLASRDHGVCAVLSSNYTRASQTADLISTAFTDVDRVTDEALQECADVYFNDDDRRLTNARIAFERLFSRETLHPSSIVVVTHANLIRYLLARLENWSRQKWESQLIPLCSISTVSMHTEDSDSQKTNPVASVRHLPPALQDRF